jgi:metal-responsive CopG/Arc/MetJ family transcriptional regulator
MALRITVSFDEATAEALTRTAVRLGKSKSEVVREAIRKYDIGPDRMSEAERLRKLRVIEEMMKQPPTRSQAEVDREIAEIRRSRRVGWRRPSDDK